MHGRESEGAGLAVLVFLIYLSLISYLTCWSACAYSRLSPSPHSPVRVVEVEPRMDGGLEERETKRLLRVCSRRAIDKLHADLETATANPETAHQIIRNASEADLSLLRGLYARSVGVTLSVMGVAFFGVLPRRTRPVVSAAVAVGVGSVAGVVYGGRARSLTYGYSITYGCSLRAHDYSLYSYGCRDRYGRGRRDDGGPGGGVCAGGRDDVPRSARVRCARPRQTGRHPIPRHQLTTACRMLTVPVTLMCTQVHAWTTRSVRR